MGELPQFYEGLSDVYSAKYHGFGVIKKWIKKRWRTVQSAIFFIAGSCLRACVGAHVAAQVFDRVDQDLDDVFRIVNERAGVLLDVLIVEGSLH